MAAIQSGSSCHIILQPDGIRLAAKAQVRLPTSAPPSLSWVPTIELPPNGSARHRRSLTIPSRQKMSPKSVFWVSFKEPSAFQS